MVAHLSYPITIPFTFLCHLSIRPQKEGKLTNPLMAPFSRSISFFLFYSPVFSPLQKKSAAGVASTRSFPLQLHAYPARPHVLCSWRTAVGSIYSGDHPPPPTWTTAWKEPGDRLAHVAWEARQEKGYSPFPFPYSGGCFAPGPWHFNGVHALLDRKDGTGGGCDWSRGAGRVGLGLGRWKRELGIERIREKCCRFVRNTERKLKLDGDGEALRNRVDCDLRNCVLSESGRIRGIRWS